MAYEVTATRRRPQRFDDLVGQEFVAETLKNSLKNGKIAHAYLFSGPRGCGKTSTARILAKALNCERAADGDFSNGPCGGCAHCQEITKGTSLDVIEIDGASNTSVNDVRQIKDEVMFPPNSSRYKIYIIDEVHMLSTSAFNALLKTIEEPPPYVVFIFATTELQKVPATIKSRCQQFNFRLVAIEQIKNLLADAAKEIGIEADEEALFWIARESTGSVRDSYTLFDQVASFSDGHITYEKIRDTLGLVGVDRLNEIFENCASGDVSQCTQTLDTFLQGGVSIEQFISDSADYIRSLMFIKNGVKKEALLGNAAERYSQKVLDAWNTIQIERALSIFLQLYRDIRYSLSPRYELELAFARLCWLSEYVSGAEVKKAIYAAHNLLAESSAGGGAANTMNHSASGVSSAGGTAASEATVASTSGGVPRSFNNGGVVPPVSVTHTAENLFARVKAQIAESQQPQATWQKSQTEWQQPQADLRQPQVQSSHSEQFQQFQSSSDDENDDEEEEINVSSLSEALKQQLASKNEDVRAVERKLPQSVEIIRDVFKGTVL